MLIQKHFGSFSLHEQMFLPKMTNKGLKLELVDENEYSSSIIKTINQCSKYKILNFVDFTHRLNKFFIL